MSNTRRHAVIIWVEADGTAQWDHSEDARLERVLTPEQKDTCEMIYRYGYRSARNAAEMSIEAKAASEPKLRIVTGRIG